MKDSDFKQAERILRLIRQLTAEELSSLEIINDNPDGPPDCAIVLESFEKMSKGAEQVYENKFWSETFYADTLLDCLLKAMESCGMTEEPDPIFHVADTSAPVVSSPGEFVPIVAADWSADHSTIIPNLVAAVEKAKTDVGFRFEPGTGFYFLWVTSDEANQISETSNTIPGYLRRQARSRYGRPGRGRLWIDDELPADLKVDPWPDNDLSRKLSEEYGGIGIKAEDVLIALRKLPGIVTDLRLNEVPKTLVQDSRTEEQERYDRQQAEYFMDPDGDGDDIP